MDDRVTDSERQDFLNRIATLESENEILKQRHKRLFQRIRNMEIRHASTPILRKRRDRDYTIETQQPSDHGDSILFSENGVSVTANDSFMVVHETAAPTPPGASTRNTGSDPPTTTEHATNNATRNNSRNNNNNNSGRTTATSTTTTTTTAPAKATARRKLTPSLPTAAKRAMVVKLKKPEDRRDGNKVLCIVDGCVKLAQNQCDRMCIACYKTVYPNCEFNGHRASGSLCKIEGCTKQGKGKPFKGLCKACFRTHHPELEYPVDKPFCKQENCKKLSCGSPYAHYCRLCFRIHFPERIVAALCVVEGCDKQAKGRKLNDMCIACFKARNPGVPVGTLCRVEGCTKRSKGSECDGMCRKCFSETASREYGAELARRWYA